MLAHEIFLDRQHDGNTLGAETLMAALPAYPSLRILTSVVTGIVT
jgi:hypothetical protein